MGGEGNDQLLGGDGDDHLDGGNGDDVMDWDEGEGSDRMEGGTGFDRARISGSGDGDSYTITPDGGRVLVESHRNVIPFKLDIGTAEHLLVSGQSGDDVITASAGLDGLVALSLNGGSGDDRITGGDGDESIRGDDGADVLVGGAGNDFMEGASVFDDDPGDDLLVGGRGDDSLRGGGDDDVLYGGRGNDDMNGGDGADMFVFNSGSDFIGDFEDGLDRIKLVRLDGINSFKDLVGLVRADSDGGVVIDFGADDLALRNLSPADLDATDFLFA